MSKKISCAKITIHTGQVFICEGLPELIKIFMKNLRKIVKPEDEDYYKKNAWIEFVKMTREEYNKIPASEESYEMFKEYPK